MTEIGSGKYPPTGMNLLPLASANGCQNIFRISFDFYCVNKLSLIVHDISGLKTIVIYLDSRPDNLGFNVLSISVDLLVGEGAATGPIGIPTDEEEVLIFPDLSIINHISFPTTYN